MPFLAPIGAWLAANAAAVTAGSALASAGTTIGLETSGALSKGSSGPSSQQEQMLLNQQNQQAQQKQEQQLFRHFAPDAQAQTGGSLSDNSLSAMIAELSGAPADTNLARQTIFGNAPGLSSGGTGLEGG